MCIWTNTGDIYSTKCGQSYPVDGHMGKYCRHCSTLITERRQGITPGPFETVIHHECRREVLSNGMSVAEFFGRESEANAHAFTKLPEIFQAGRDWLACRNGYQAITAPAAQRLKAILDEAEGVQ